MIRDKSLTIVLGSGFSEGLKLPSTDDLTNIVRGKPYQAYHALVMQSRQISPAEAMWRMASSYYYQPNFETMLHLAETVMGYDAVKSWLQQNDRAKPAYGAFMNVMPHWSEIVEGIAGYDLPQFIGSALSAIARAVTDAADAITDEQKGQARLLFERVLTEYSATIATLNYDDIVERLLERWRDGFVGEGDVCHFRPRSLLDDSDNPALLHLHGSVRWYRATENEGAREDELLRASNGHFADAHNRRKAIAHFAQSGEMIVIAPLISGLRKTDKISVEPFSTYHWQLQDSLLRSPRALIIGYGGWDPYLSNLIASFRNNHGESTRLAIVAYRAPRDPWRDYSLLLGTPTDGTQIDINEWGLELDNAFNNRAWTGSKTVTVFTNGFPLRAADLDGLMAFLAS